MTNARLVFSPLIFLFLLAGCGSTVRGVGKDIHRIGSGVKMIFISEPEVKEGAKQNNFFDFLKRQEDKPSD